MIHPSMDWAHSYNIGTKKYVCGHCGESISSQKGYEGNFSNIRMGEIYICHSCDKPTYFDLVGNVGQQTPGPVFGNSVSDVTDQTVYDLYEEARECCSVNAYTSAVLACRKLLMHIAVAQGAQTGQNFIAYVQYLADNNYVPKGSEDWVDHIRKKGNEANHEIVIMNEEDAKDLISFIEMLLKIIYEFPAHIAKKKASKP